MTKKILALFLVVAVATSIAIWSPNFYKKISPKRDEFGENNREIMAPDIIGRDHNVQEFDIIENGTIIKTEETFDSSMFRNRFPSAMGERYLKIWVVKGGQYYLCEMRLLESDDFDLEYIIKPTIAICKMF